MFPASDAWQKVNDWLADKGVSDYAKKRKRILPKQKRASDPLTDLLNETEVFSAEQKFKVGEQWVYRGNRSPKWFFLAGRGKDSPPSGIAETARMEVWPFLEEIAKLHVVIAQLLREPADSVSTATKSETRIARFSHHPRRAQNQMAANGKAGQTF